MCGSNYGAVTVLASALKFLVAPFKWEGVFVPMVPLNAMEVLDSPVPFIVGVPYVLDDRMGICPTASVLYADDYIVAASPATTAWFMHTRSPSDCADLLQLREGQPLTTAQRLQRARRGSQNQRIASKKRFLCIPATESSPVDFDLCRTIGNMKRRIGLSSLPSADAICESTTLFSPNEAAPEESDWTSNMSVTVSQSGSHDVKSSHRHMRVQVRRRPSTAVPSPALIRDSSSSSDSRGTKPILCPYSVSDCCIQKLLKGIDPDTRKIIAAIRKELRQYSMSLCGDIVLPGGWRKYGTMNQVSGSFDFVPQWFLDPLRARFEFQSSFVKTQLFLSFIDTLRTEYDNSDSAR